MASKTFAMSSSKSWVAGQVVVSSSSNGSEKNSSNITITLQGRRTDGGKSYNAFASNFYIAIDGVIVATDTNGCTVSGTSWQNILTYSETIDHNNDGTKSITITVGGNITETSFSFNETSSTFDLDSIPRYATITKFENIGVTQTTATFDWWCDVGCSALQYKIGNGDWIDSNGIPFTVTGLSPGTTYNIKINVKRADSGLWTESSAVSITTEPIAILTDASGFKFDIGEDLSFAVNYADKNDSIAKVYYLNSDNIWTLFENTFDELTFAVGTTDITFSFSENADLLYSLCPNSNELSIKIDFGTILDEVEYFNSYIGTACVTNSNPIFTNFICENIDSTTIDILGEENKTYIPSGHGLMRISIDNNTSKAIAQNFATIKYYDVSVLHPNGYTFIQRNIDEVNQDITIDISGLTAVGEYKAKVVAWDSRNNCSEEVVRSFYVIDYHAPNTVINASRLNGFDSEILLQFTSTYSLLLLNSVAYNEIISIKYRTQSVEDLIWSDYVELTGDNIVQDGSADGTIVISRNKDNILTRL